MEKEDFDELYHLLRKVSNEPQDDRSMFPPQNIISGLVRHVLGGGDYLALVQYSTFYGEKYLMEPTGEAIAEIGWEFSRVVDLGCGLGWLGRGLATGLGVDYMGVDKRPWTGMNVQRIDLETQKGMNVLKAILLPSDILVMSDFLHCIDDPVGLIDELGDWPMAVLEYTNEHEDYMVSYADQLKRHGAEAIAPQDFELEFIGRETKAVDLFPYVLVLADKRKK